MNEKTAIVTGGSRGIGLATAKRLGLDGYNVVIFATRPKKDCEEQLKELEHLGICLHYVRFLFISRAKESSVEIHPGNTSAARKAPYHIIRQIPRMLAECTAI